MKGKNRKLVIAVIVAAVIAIAAIAFVIGRMTGSPSQNSTKDYIGMDKAKSIALKDAGISESRCEFTKESLDENDDDPAAYDVEFVSSGKEYSYEIDAESGDIVEESVEKAESYTKNDDSDSTASSDKTGSDRIGLAKAKRIALKDAGLLGSDVTFTKKKLDKDDGIEVYEVEFVSSGTEYEYEINANTGKIIDSSRETQ